MDADKSGEPMTFTATATSTQYHGKMGKPGNVEGSVWRWGGASAPPPFGFGDPVVTFFCVLNQVYSWTRAHGRCRGIDVRMMSPAKWAQ